MGMNSKAVEAKARKDAAKKANDEAIAKKKEDELWRDDDKHVNKKLERQNEKEKKKLEQNQKKALNKAAYEEEAKVLETIKPSVKPAKVTRAQIAAKQEESKILAASKTTSTAEKVPTHLEIEVVQIRDYNNPLNQDNQARNIDEAIQVLSKVELDRHPERRVKAAYAAFEETNLPRLKAEYPNLRLSQLKQMLKKDWMKSPENPLNQHALAFNAKP